MCLIDLLSSINTCVFQLSGHPYHKTKHRKDETSKRVLSDPLFGALTSVLLGAFVMLGWFIQEPRTVQVHPTFAPMQFNTALGFSLSGIAMLLLFLGHRRVTAKAQLRIARAWDAYHFAKYIEGFRIDNLFIEHTITVENLSSRPNSSLKLQ